MSNSKISIDEAQKVYNKIREGITIHGKDLPELDLKAVFGSGKISMKKVQDYVNKLISSI